MKELLSSLPAMPAGNGLAWLCPFFGNEDDNADYTDTLVIIGTELVQESQYRPYLETLDRSRVKVIMFPVAMQLLTVNHLRDVQNLKDIAAAEAAKGRRVHLLGYSVGGKFAAKVGQECPDVWSVFLLDPVDGGLPVLPDLLPHLPVFFKDGQPPITVPTWVVATQLGEACGGAFGLPCVTVGLGATHFMKFVDPEQLHYFKIVGAGHLQVIDPYPIPPLLIITENLCTAGERTRDDIYAELIPIFQEFCKECFTPM